MRWLARPGQDCSGMTQLWAGLDDGRAHRVRDFRGYFIETWCGVRLSKTRASVHEAHAVACPCEGCETAMKAKAAA